MTLQLSSLAERDIEQILSYTLEVWGINQFRKYQKLMEKSLQDIASDHQLPNSKSRENLFTGCRSYAFGKHLIFYRIKNEVVEVVRILHQRMDFESHIPNDYRES